MAVRIRNAERIPLDGTIVHSDRGTQYCSKLFQSRLNELNMRSSVSEVGQCWDNAPGEAIWSSLKRETLIGRRMFSSHEAAAREVTHWINIYNQLRPHSAIGMQIPLEYDQSLKSRRMCASSLCSRVTKSGFRAPPQILKFPVLMRVTLIAHLKSSPNASRNSLACFRQKNLGWWCPNWRQAALPSNPVFG